MKLRQRIEKLHKKTHFVLLDAYILQLTLTVKKISHTLITLKIVKQFSLMNQTLAFDEINQLYDETTLQKICHKIKLN